MEMLREDRAIWRSLELRQEEMPWKSEMGCCGEARGLKTTISTPECHKQAAGQEMNSGKWLLILFAGKAPPAPST